MAAMFAEGATGNAFLDQLVALTGADIQASNDVTGSAELGGDWDLEVTKGAIESSLVISAVGQKLPIRVCWQAVLQSLVMAVARVPLSSRCRNLLHYRCQCNRRQRLLRRLWG